MLFGREEPENETVVALVASYLRRDISFGVFPPDAKLKLEDVRARYGGSNNSVREAMRILSGEGLVEAVAQRGFRVASATEADRRDVLRVRIEIESLALTWSLENGNARWESGVLAAEHKLRRAESSVGSNPDDLSALEWDVALQNFHISIADACGSNRIIALQKQFFDQSRRYMLTGLREDRIDFAAWATHHRGLVPAVLDRDLDPAIAALTQVITGEDLSG